MRRPEVGQAVNRAGFRMETVRVSCQFSCKTTGELPGFATPTGIGDPVFEDCSL